MAGANPTLTAVTDDASRGGLFTQSNVANPVTGADAAGTTVNDSIITLQVSIDGVEATGMFSLNQQGDDTVRLVFTGIAGSGTGTGGGNPVERGFIDAQDNIVLQRQDGSEVVIAAQDFVTQEELRIALGNIMTGGANTFADLTDTPDEITVADALQLVRVNAAGDALEFVTPTSGSVAVSDFSSIDNTVVITDNSGVIDLEARPAWEGNANIAPAGTTTVSGTNTVQVERLTLAADTGLVLVDNGAGAYTIQLAGTTPPPAGAPTATQPPPTSVFVASPPQIIQVTPTGGTFDTTGGATPVRPTVTPPAGTGPITPMTVVNPGGGSATVTIPAGDTNDPGNYMVMIETDTTGPDGMVVMSTISETIERFVPFLQSRNEITPTNVGTASQAAWSGEVTSIPGSGTLWIGVLETALPASTAFANIAGFPVRVSRVGTTPIAVPSASGTISMNVYRLQANAGVSITEFRSTR